MNRDQIPSLTGLRFVAAMAVVVSHAIPWFFKFPFEVTTVNVIGAVSGAAMTLFFVLSGFVIYLNYSSSIGTITGLWNFFVARFARLYPLYFICVAFDLLMQWSRDMFPVSHVGALPFYLTLTQTWLYLPIGGNSLVYQFGPMPQASWSISTEFFFYLAFPFLCVAISVLQTARSRIIAAVALSVAALVGLTFMNLSDAEILTYGAVRFGPIGADIQDSFFRWVAYFSPYVRLCEFALGCITAAIFMSLQEPSQREKNIGVRVTWLAVIAIAVLQWLMFGVHDKSLVHKLIQQLHMNFGFAPFMAILIFCCARYESAVVRALSHPKIVLAGEASYSIYLLHAVVINAFRYEVGPISAWTLLVGACLQLVVVIAATVGLSLISWNLIEVPSRRALRRLLSVDEASTSTKAVAVPTRG